MVAAKAEQGLPNPGAEDLMNYVKHGHQRSNSQFKKYDDKKHDSSSSDYNSSERKSKGKVKSFVEKDDMMLINEPPDTTTFEDNNTLD